MNKGPGLATQVPVLFLWIEMLYRGTPIKGHRNRTTRAARIRERIMRSTQTIRISYKEISMSVPSTQGMEAEKNRISDTHTMAVTY